MFKTLLHKIQQLLGDKSMAQSQVLTDLQTSTQALIDASKAAALLIQDQGVALAFNLDKIAKLQASLSSTTELLGTVQAQLVASGDDVTAISQLKSQVDAQVAAINSTIAANPDPGSGAATPVGGQTPTGQLATP